MLPAHLEVRLRLLMSTSAGAAVTAAPSDNLYAQPRTTALLPLRSCCGPSLSLCFVPFQSILIWPSARAAITAFSSPPPHHPASPFFLFSPSSALRNPTDTQRESQIRREASLNIRKRNLNKGGRWIIWCTERLSYVWEQLLTEAQTPQ